MSASGDASGPGGAAEDGRPPQDDSAPRRLAWFLDRTPPPYGTPPLRTPGEWNQQAVAAFIARRCLKEGPMPDSKPKPRIVIHESDACAGVIHGRTCADCDGDDCEHECHHTEPAPEVRPQDVPDELVALTVPILCRTCPKCEGKHAPIGDDVNCPTCLDSGSIGPIYVPGEAADYVRQILAAVLPEHEQRVRKAVFAELFGTPKEIAAREAETATETRDDTVDLCERARPGEHAQRVREQVAAEIAEPSVWPDPTGRWSADQADAARAMKEHILRRIARGGT